MAEFEPREQSSQSSPIDTSRFRRVDAKPSLIENKTRQLANRVVGQHEAARAVAREMIISEAGMTDPTKPRTIFIFAGPTGVGKTEMSKAIAKDLFGDQWEKHHKIVHCNTLSTKGDVSKLTGTSAGWVGYGDKPLITPEFLNQEGGTVVVFDEIEKAHEEVWQALLSITDSATLPVFLAEKGRRTNGDAEPVDLRFHNSIVIFTSNAGSEDMQQARTGLKTMGFQRAGQKPVDLKEAAKRGLKEAFSSIPELLGRVGDNRIIVFGELGQDDYGQIFDLILADVNNRITGEILVTDSLKQHIIQQAVGTGEYGARDLKNMIREHIEATTAEHRASGSVVPTTEILLDYEDGKIVVHEGYEVAPKQASQKPEEEPSAFVPIERVQMEFAIGTPFKLQLPDKALPKDDVSYQVELKQDNKLHGMVKIREVQVPNARNTVLYPSGKLYTFQLELHGNSRQHPKSIQMQLNNDVYTAKTVFLSRKASGRAPYQQIYGWQQKDTTKDLVEFAFSWEDMKKAEFIITDEE